MHGTLQQATLYPFSDVVQLDLLMDHPQDFTIHFRIPSWTASPSVSVNSKRQTIELKPGTFAGLRRQWKTGDRIELHLPMTARLEPIDAQHPDIVALMHGPLVLFPITPGAAAPLVTRQQLLNAKRSTGNSWQAQTTNGPVKLLPFTEISDEPYTTYVRVT